MKPQPICRHQCGVSLVELIVFIVIVSVGMLGLLSVLNLTAGKSSDPMLRKQALALAEATMEEVLSRLYQNNVGGDNGATPTLGCTPSTVPSCIQNNATDRSHYNDVDDYDHWSLPGALAVSGYLTNYTVAITVAAPAATLGSPAVTAKKVTVTVSGGPEVITLVGYRTHYYD